MHSSDLLSAISDLLERKTLVTGVATVKALGDTEILILPPSHIGDPVIASMNGLSERTSTQAIKKLNSPEDYKELYVLSKSKSLIELSKTYMLDPRTLEIIINTIKGLGGSSAF